LKALYTIIIVALIVGAAGLIYSGRTGGSPVSDSAQAIRLCEEGTADFHAFRLNDAVKKLTTCLELDPNLAEASISLTNSYGRLGRIPEYMASLARSDSLVAQIVDDDRRMMAQLQLSKHGHSKFKAIGDSLIKRLAVEKPENVVVLEAMATRAQTDDEKEKAWRRLLKVDPNYAVAYNMLGYLELARGNFEESEEFLQKYAFLSPGLANPHDSLGDLYSAQGRYEEAEAAYAKSITIQPDFYASMINLGKTFLARGQIDKGTSILEKIRSEIAGSKLELEVDVQILMTMMLYGLEEELATAAPAFYTKWPENGDAVFFRAMALAHMGNYAGSEAVMDSALTKWRASESYRSHPKGIDMAGKRYRALVSDLADSPSTRIRHWASLVTMGEDEPMYEQWYRRWRLARALLDDGKPEKALEQVIPVLETNPRQINPLLLAVEAEIALGRAEEARQIVDQAKFALAKADADFPPLIRVQELEKRVQELEAPR
jgi:tetratricopeptide (TPR) repeat protein